MSMTRQVSRRVHGLCDIELIQSPIVIIFRSIFFQPSERTKFLIVFINTKHGKLTLKQFLMYGLKRSVAK